MSEYKTVPAFKETRVLHPGVPYEAGIYVFEAGEVWEKMPGALEWLAEAVSPRGS